MELNITEDMLRTLKDELEARRNDLRSDDIYYMYSNETAKAKESLERMDRIGNIISALDLSCDGMVGPQFEPVIEALCSLVNTVATSQFFTQQVWKKRHPDWPVRPVVLAFITKEMYKHGIHAHFGPIGLQAVDKASVETFLKEWEPLFDEYRDWSSDGR